MDSQIGKGISKTQKMVLHKFFENWIEKSKEFPSDNASGQTYELLANLCQSADGIVIDLGCGFSSFVIREFSGKSYKCVTVDLEISLLDSVENYCSWYFFLNGEFVLWKDYIKQDWPDVSLIFFKIGDTSSRATFYKPVLDKYLRKGVKILFDDMHKSANSNHLQWVLRKFKHKKIDVKEETMDQHGRFCCLIEGI